MSSGDEEGEADADDADADPDDGADADADADAETDDAEEDEDEEDADDDEDRRAPKNLSGVCESSLRRMASSRVSRCVEKEGLCVPLMFGRRRSQ
jgi:cobalamin biosynthesis protein CobT